MAQKKLTSLGIFAKTDKPASPTAEKIAAELNMKRGALAAAFIRYALKEYKAGKMKTKTAKTLDL